MERRIGELRAEAVECGKFQGPVTSRLVSTVLAAVEGTTFVLAITPRGEIKERIREAVQGSLGPGGRHMTACCSVSRPEIQNQLDKLLPTGATQGVSRK